MRVLVLGSGAKDHAFAWLLNRSAYISALYVAPGNPGTANIACNLPEVDPSDGEAVYKAVVEHKIDAVFIGTEEPLLAGVREYLIQKSAPCFGASKEALKIESDKSFAREFCLRHGIPVPEYTLCSSIEDLKAYIDANEGKKLTIKYNTMAPSRILISSSEKSALVNYAQMLLPRGPVFVENFVKGVAITVTIFMDNNGYLALPITSEYTKVSHDDVTPTGGMGAVAPVPLYDGVREKVIERIIMPTINGMEEEGLAYKGVLTFSIIINSHKDPILVDYHVRFNDPGFQAVAPLVKTDIGEVLFAMQNDSLSSLTLEQNGDSSVAVVLASHGYPMQPETGREVEDLTNAFQMDIDGKAKVFMGAIKKTTGGRYFTDGGRVLTVVGTGISLEEANEQAYRLIESKDFKALWFRDDIGNKFFNQG